jgi:hypothetical protein
MHPELTRIAVEDRQARLRADYAASRRNAAAWRAFVLRLRRVLGWALVDAGIRIAAGRIESPGGVTPPGLMPNAEALRASPRSMRVRAGSVSLARQQRGPDRHAGHPFLSHLLDRDFDACR